MFYLWILLKTIAWEIVSLKSLRNCPKEVKEESEYIGTFVGRKTKQNKTKSRVVKQQKITVNHTKNQTFQVDDFLCFSLLGKMQESGLIEMIPLICILTIESLYLLLFPSQLPLRTRCQEWLWWLMA